MGASLVAEMARAVETSRYTVMLLTPAYLQSNFTEFENLLADHLGLEQRARRLLAVMREKCDPPLRMYFRLWLDMMDDAQIDAALARLVQELHLPPDK